MSREIAELIPATVPGPVVTRRSPGRLPNGTRLAPVQTNVFEQADFVYTHATATGWFRFYWIATAETTPPVSVSVRRGGESAPHRNFQAFHQDSVAATIAGAGLLTSAAGFGSFAAGQALVWCVDVWLELDDECAVHVPGTSNTKLAYLGDTRPISERSNL